MPQAPSNPFELEPKDLLVVGILLVLAAAFAFALVAVPRMVKDWQANRGHYSMRSLLIVMTLVAVVLGLIAWAR